MSSTIIRQLEKEIKACGFELFGFTEFKRPLSFPLYAEWIDHGFHGKMNYLKTHLEQKQDPKAWLPKARSVISLAVSYVPHPRSTPNQTPLPSLRTARYAQGEDYHYWLQEKLENLAAQLKILFGNEEFLCFTDSKPLMERDYAVQAGLGWIGKNSCLIHQKQGSFLLLGEIVTSLRIPSTEQTHPDLCGTCRRCINACPTQAILENKTLDATKCISYWTIESKELPPEPLRPQFGDWFFGCDICQTVCPWNVKVFGEQMEEPISSRLALIEDLKYILTTSNKQLMRTFKGTPLTRAGGRGLKRNALIVIGNLGLRELKEEVEALIETEERLSDLANWVLRRL